MTDKRPTSPQTEFVAKYSKEKTELRDRFAMAALTGLGYSPNAEVPAIADLVYDIADACMERRKR